MSNPYPSDATRPEQAARGSGVSDTAVRESTAGQLMSEVTSDLSELVRKEIELARAEIRHEGRRAGRGAGMLGGGGFAAYMTLLFASVALMFLLDRALPLDWAAFIVAMIYLVVAVPLVLRGRRELRDMSGAPQTVDTLKEDVQWAANRTK
ncbi:phage holin family protein [Parafrankia discariae]|uniref:phage holin family protein n=1 Tax=Parafrankia discariae TaxID=365528 RepID=UPI0003751FF9|nr:phage holin family protein [Parafrankia discariae]